MLRRSVRPDLIVEARAFHRGELRDVEFGIDAESGTILSVKKTLPGHPRRRFPGRLLLPSGVDLHVHFRDPGAPAKEDFRTGTLGAALGGIGTVLDMPNTRPLVDRLSRLEDKREQAKAKACVDWGLWCTMTPQTRDARALLQASAGLKIYMAPTTEAPQPPASPELRRYMDAARRAGRLVAVHAELVGGDAADHLAGHDRLRGSDAEMAAVRRLGEAAPEGASVHVAHVTTAAAVDLAKSFRFTVGATPHHLLLSHDEGGLGAWAKVNPPLRNRRERAELWDAYASRRVDVVESDHAPHTQEEKRRPFGEAPAGVPGVETTYPLLLRAVRTRGLDLATLVQTLSERPAQRLGVPKGRLEPGHDADFFVIDPARPMPVRGAELQSRCGWTPFEGWESYPVETHFLHGEPVVEDHRFVGHPGRGRATAPGTVLPSATAPPES